MGIRYTLKTKEVWKKIPDYLGYEVSNYGNIRSYWSIVSGESRGVWGINFNKKPKPMKLITNEKGYYRTRIRRNDGKKHSLYVHSVVLIVFVGKRPENMQAMHLNGNNQNNYVKNLKWGTMIENMNDRIKHNGFAKKLTIEQVLEIRMRYKEGNKNQTKLAKKYKVNQTTIRDIVNFKTWRHI